MAVSLRPILPEDFPALYALDQACFVPGIAWSKAELQYFLKYPGNIGVVAEDEARHIAGFAIAGKQLRKGAVLGRLITIDVEAALRRRGVGHMLFEETEKQLREATAQAFYTRHGFVRTGRIPGYYMGRIDALAMEKQL